MASGFARHNLVRYSPGNEVTTSVSDNILRISSEAAIKTIYDFLIAHELTPRSDLLDQMANLAQEYLSCQNDAYRLGLLGSGGVPERNFLALWSINKFLAPRHYIESGYYKGSSIYAALSNDCLETLSAFDPDPSKLMLKDFPKGLNVNFYDVDFSETPKNNLDSKGSLVYFDDHINTAKRILESEERGFKRLIFDDSCGITGTMQRKYPSMPSLYFIMNCDRIQSGDYLQWTFIETVSDSPIKKAIKKMVGKRFLSQEFTFDDETVRLCKEAKRRVRKVAKIPDLSDYVLNRDPGVRFVDLTQHLVLLH